MSIEEKYDEVRQLISMGKEKGYLLYEEVNELLPADITSSEELDDLFSTSATPASRSSTRSRSIARTSSSASAPTAAAPATSRSSISPLARSTRPTIRPFYLREMGTVPLLTREGESDRQAHRARQAGCHQVDLTPTIARHHRHGRAAARRQAHHPRAGDLQRRGDHRRARRRAPARCSSRRGAKQHTDWEKREAKVGEARSARSACRRAR